MKKIIAVILCLLFVVTFMVACKKDNEEPEGTSDITSEMGEESTTEKKTVNPDRGFKGTETTEITEETTTEAGDGEGGSSGPSIQPAPRDPLETTFFY